MRKGLSGQLLIKHLHFCICEFGFQCCVTLQINYLYLLQTWNSCRIDSKWIAEQLKLVICLNADKRFLNASSRLCLSPSLLFSRVKNDVQCFGMILSFVHVFKVLAMPLGKLQSPQLKFNFECSYQFICFSNDDVLALQLTYTIKCIWNWQWKIKNSNFYSQILESLGTAPRARKKSSAGQKWPAGLLFDIPALD